MKAHFRKTEYYTSHNATTPVELDSEKFPDFKGETQEEFLNYIEENLDQWIDGDDDLPFDEGTINALYELKEGTMKEYWGSYRNYFDGELQIGESTPDDNHKNGNFKTIHSIKI